MLTIAGAIATCYLSFLSYLFLRQEKLIFLGAKPNYLAYASAERFTHTLELDDVTLQGWRFNGNANEDAPVIIYFGGNAQDVVYVIPFLSQLHASRIYTYNYRGYGLSGGYANESNVYSDAIRIFQSVARDNPGKEICVIGQSLGTAVSGYLASKLKVDRIVLISPLDSVYDIARSHFFYLIPKIIVRNRLNLIDHARSVSAPSVVIVGSRDTIIPTSHSKRTFAQLLGQKALIEVEEAGHNDILAYDKTLQSINRFMRES